MKEIPLNLVEKQSLSVLIDNILFELSFKLCNNIMAATIIRNGETIVENRRVVAGVGIIPEGDREEGNFIILTNNDDLPYFEQFASTHVLVYANEKEIIDIRQQLNEINIRKVVKADVTPVPAIKQPAITTQPTGKTVAAFDMFTLTVVATNAVSYQWRKDGNIVGTDSATYTDTDAQVSDAGKYKVIVTGEKYSSAIASTEVTVSVTPPPLPTFKTQPPALAEPTTGPYAGKKVVVWAKGKPLEIKGAIGNVTSSYQWQMLDANGTTWTDVPGQTNADLSWLEPVETSYRLKITNSTGSAFSNELSAFEAYLFMQNDSAAGAGTQFSLAKTDNDHYSMVNPVVSAGVNRPLGAFIRRTDTPDSNITGIGVNGPGGVSSAPTVVSATPTTGRQVQAKILTTGNAVIKVTYGPLTSEVSFEVK